MSASVCVIVELEPMLVRICVPFGILMAPMFFTVIVTFALLPASISASHAGVCISASGRVWSEMSIHTVPGL